MDRLTLAENEQLNKENASLRKQFKTYLARGTFAEFDDFVAALSISEIQKERIDFLIKELKYVCDRKQNLIDEEKKTSALGQLENLDNLEVRLEIAKQKKRQLELDLESFERKKTRELSEIKSSAARQNASLLSNL
ncbi:hypothetical protein SteCoe_28220 [Stentor coeruleus]|uniref:Uncharacterized protein n=1 Tax=Stentor coeruleus TaxID=5963 RepID=A0A1R2B8P4_9CILI|nr:hypothetical protein SteCoe_28220 [Stentor coeruleus]